MISEGILAYISVYKELNVGLDRLALDYVHLFSDKFFYLFLYIGCFISLIYLAMSLVTVKKDEEREEALDSKKVPFVTVQIPTMNEIIALRCAKKCLQLDYPKDKYEILIGDDSNDPSVSKKLDEFARKHSKVKIIRRESNEGFKPGNLNNMLKHTKGEIIAIFDSDFIPDKDFLKRIVAPFNDKKVSAVQSRWKFINADKNMVTALASSIVYTFHYVSLSLLKKFGFCFLCGSAEAVRKSDLIKWGGWRSGSLTEDIEYSLRIHKHGKKIFYLPGLQCFNEAPTRPFDLYKQQMRWAYGVVSAYKVHTKDILTSRLISGKQKLFTMLGAFGYLLPIILIMIFIFGAMTLVTTRPAPIDWARFFSETTRNVLLTSGLLVANSIALYRARKIKLLPKVLLSSFSLGLVVTYFVNVGIVKAIINKPMKWFLLKKSTRV